MTTRPSGAPARREEEINVESVYIGRGTDNDLSLNGLTVSLHHATIGMRGDGVWIEVAEAPSVLVNGRPKQQVRIQPGDSLRIGQFELRVLPNEGSEDLTLEVEQIEKTGTEREELRRRTRMGVESGWLTRRRLSWLLVVTLFTAFLGVPLLLEEQSSWSSGPVSNKHAFIEENCERCHEGFQPVKNDGCLECHYDIEPHTADDAAVKGLAETRCATCHVEHNGTTMLADLGEPLCTGCHASIREALPGSKLADASDFGDHHPEFRLHVVTEPGSGKPREAVWSPELEERSGLAFSHLRHVGQKLPMPDGSKQNLACDSCHQQERDGTTMKPVSFDTNCRHCHRLTFDDDLPERDAVHADPVRMREELSELYANQVLRGAVTDGKAPARLRFRKPGLQVTPKERPIVLAWVEDRVARASRHLLEEPGECKRCHEIQPGSASDGGAGVAPVEVASVWMPKSEFRHDTHAPFRCRDCHPAAAVYDPTDAPDLPRPDWSHEDMLPYALFTPEELADTHGGQPSTRSSDVMLPSIELCRTCHGGQTAGSPKVASRCGMCHPFHRSDLGPAFLQTPGAAARVQSARAEEKAHGT